ncbi:GGDEF domain-containing protein [Alteromonas sp. 1_MG-2023]|uniref:GGDEF domain-containing protein n=1 Tax=Alteromonas sp. 1_MG-2023 TaxID=3062669 RepID=UPI0026E287A4|nr:GGDEF domain-containing protein [Alteromonas sp. 1_MG-2023]MDO6567091.1 GGDEF domain-containing protein [Alteromonas sp. 1_MG-2023]
MNIRFSCAFWHHLHLSLNLQKPLFCLVAVLISLAPLHAFANNTNNVSDAEKFRQFGNLVNTVMYMWNTPYGLTNEEILTRVEASGIENDSTQMGTVIRAVLVEIAKSDTPSAPKFPLVSDSLPFNADWEYLKKVNLRRYVALKAIFILSLAANKYPEISERLKQSIPLLYKLKLETLDTADHKAVAIASMWLAQEYLELNLTRAVVELEYALPYISDYDENYALETTLHKRLGHLLLSEAYMNLNAPYKALSHQKAALNDSKNNNNIDAYKFSGIVTALNRLDRFEEAEVLAQEAQQVAKDAGSIQQELYSLWLRVSVYLHKGDESDKQQIALLTRNLSKFENVTLPADLPPAKHFLETARSAIVDTEKDFKDSLNAFIATMERRASRSSYSSTILLNQHRDLRDFYNLRGDFEKAFYHQKKYEHLLNQPQGYSQQMDELVIDSPLRRDITINKLQEMARLKDKQNLKLKADRFQALAFALIAVLSTFLLFWFWRRQRSRAKASEFDFLTGALIRKAMFKAIAKPMSTKVSSCLVLIDLDHFKRINDRYGHVVGDEVLSKFGGFVRQRIRKTDKFCRYGGEEFLLYLHDTTEENANALLEDIKKSIESHREWSATEATFSASFSAGVIQVKGERNINKIIKACDNLLYRAKSNGRGKIETMSFPAYLNEQM